MSRSSSTAIAAPGSEAAARRQGRWHLRWPTGLEVAAFICFVFVVGPLFVVGGAALNEETMTFPPQQLTLRWMGEAIVHPRFMHGALVSVVVATVSAVFATLFAIPVALLLRKLPVGLARLLSLTFLGPLLVPTVIFALALYQVMIFTFGGANPVALIIGHIIITMPFPVRTITAVTENLDPSLEDAASSVGADPFRTFMSITLPLIKPGVLAGFLFAFITSWNDFSVSIFLTPREFQPLSIQIYEYLLYEYRPLIAAVSTWSVLWSAVMVILIDRLVGLNVFAGSRSK